MSHEEMVEAFLQTHSVPNVVSLDPETHLFHFDEQDWRNSSVILVNKNGNHMRLLRGTDGKWTLLKTWTGITKADDWMRVSAPKLTDPEKMIHLVTAKDRNGNEMLSLLPKEAHAAGRRRVVWRQHLLMISFDRTSDKFSLILPEDNRQSEAFAGKPWESHAAAAWCTTNLSSEVKLWAPGRNTNPYEREVKDQEVYEALEDNPLWGAFG